MATDESKTVVGELSRIAQALEGKSGDHVGPAGPYEKSFVRYSVGTGTFHLFEGAGYIIVEGTMYKLDGTEDGQYQAVFKAWFTDATALLQWPPPPPQVFDQPSPPGHIAETNDTKAKWTFGDGSYVSGFGPAISYIALLKDGGLQFWVSATALLDEGGGRFENAVGQETSLGSTYFPPGTPPELKPGFKFDAYVTHSFRVILGRDRGQLPPGGGQGEGGGGQGEGGKQSKAGGKQGKAGGGRA